jgi:curved DNA-binding protein CbpA
MVARVLLSYYDILGIHRSADIKEIKIAHRQKAEIYHPDKVFYLGESQRKAAEMEMKLINNARDILLDPDQRRLYDLYLDGALEAEEVEEAFIVVEEWQEERSPLWKTAMDTIGQRWERRMDNLRRMAGLEEEDEILEACEVLEVVPLKDETDDVPEDKAFDVIVVEPLKEGKKKKKKTPGSKNNGKSGSKNSGKSGSKNSGKNGPKNSGKNGPKNTGKNGSKKKKEFEVVGIVKEDAPDEDFVD